MLSENPQIGRARPELRAGARTLVAGQHVTVYAPTADAVVDARIAHRSRDLRAALKAEP